MADYKDIAGTTVRVNAGILTSGKTGELFYDSTNSNFDYRHPNVTSAGAWRTGGNLNSARHGMSGCGIQTAALSIGGGPPPTPGAVGIVESYNGGSWTEIADLNTARAFSGANGTTTSALAYGGDGYPGICESWNGSTWTEVADMNMD